MKQSSQLVSLVKPPRCGSGRVHTHRNCSGSHRFCSSCFIALVSSCKLPRLAVPRKRSLHPESVQDMQTVTKMSHWVPVQSCHSAMLATEKCLKVQIWTQTFFFFIEPVLLPLLVYKIVGENSHRFQSPQLRADDVVTSLNWHLLKGRNHITKK